MIDEEHTSLTAAVAALGDDQGPHPTIEQIAAARAVEVRRQARDAIQTVVARAFGSQSINAAARVIDALEAAGLAIVQRRPE